LKLDLHFHELLHLISLANTYQQSSRQQFREDMRHAESVENPAAVYCTECRLHSLEARVENQVVLINEPHAHRRLDTVEQRLVCRSICVPAERAPCLRDRPLGVRFASSLSLSLLVRPCDRPRPSSNARSSASASRREIARSSAASRTGSCGNRIPRSALPASTDAQRRSTSRRSDQRRWPVSPATPRRSRRPASSSPRSQWIRSPLRPGTP
jgi:hypothetical protein